MERSESGADCNREGYVVETGIKEPPWDQFSTCLEIFLHMESSEIYAQTRTTKEKYVHINIYAHFHKTDSLCHIKTQTS